MIISLRARVDKTAGRFSMVKVPSPAKAVPVGAGAIGGRAKGATRLATVRRVVRSLVRDIVSVG